MLLRKSIDRDQLHPKVGDLMVLQVIEHERGWGVFRVIRVNEDEGWMELSCEDLQQKPS